MQIGIVMSLHQVEEWCAFLFALCQTVFFYYDHQNAMFLYIMHDQGEAAQTF